MNTSKKTDEGCPGDFSFIFLFTFRVFFFFLNFSDIGYVILFRFRVQEQTECGQHQGPSGNLFISKVYSPTQGVCRFYCFFFGLLHISVLTCFLCVICMSLKTIMSIALLLIHSPPAPLLSPIPFLLTPLPSPISSPIPFPLPVSLPSIVPSP